MVVTQAAARPAVPALPPGYAGDAGQAPYGYEPQPEVLPAPPRPAPRRFIVVDGYTADGPEGFMMGRAPV